MPSGLITEAPIALFLGAGASEPLGKMVMKKFIDHISDQPNFRSSELFKTIVEIEPDLEFLFEELTGWASKRRTVAKLQPRPGLQPSSLLLDGMGPLAPFGASPTDSGRIIEEAEGLLRDLRSEVFRGYGSVAPVGGKQLHAVFDPVFDRCLGDSFFERWPLIIFTTNYDPAVEEYCANASSKYRLVDGFRREHDLAPTVWNADVFDGYALSGERRNIALFKLHGSANWKAYSGRIIKLDLPIYSQETDDHRNLLIYPAKTKVALEDPYFTAYDYLQRTLDGCSGLIAIGYSFRDYDSLTKLKSAARKNRKLEILVVDPQAQQLKGYLATQGCRFRRRRRDLGMRTKDRSALPGYSISSRLPSGDTKASPRQ